MQDIDGTEMSEEKLLEEAGHLVAEACCLLFETQDEKAHAAAYMADSLLKYIYTIYRNENILSASADYNALEEKRYQDKLNLNA